jgi:HprK-related kinase B
MPGGTRLRVRTNSRVLAEALARHFAAFPGDGGEPELLVQAVDGESPACDLPFVPHESEGGKEEYADLSDGRVVRKRRTGLLLVFGPAGNWIFGPCAAKPQQVVNALNARLADQELARGAALLHAAAVARGGAALAVAGLAGAGKTTLALELMRRGADFVTNDRLFVTPEPDGFVCCGVARPPRVNPGTILANDRLGALLDPAERAAFAALPPAELWGLERKYDAPIETCFGPGRVRLRARLRALAVLCWKRDGGAVAARQTTLAAVPELVPAIAKDLGVLFLVGPRPADPSAYLAALGELPVLVLAGGADFAQGATLCQDILSSVV